MRTTSLFSVLSYGGRPRTLLIALFALALVAVGCDTTSNGLTDPTVADVMSSRGDLTVLAGALQQTDLAETLRQRDTSFTVFAPPNGAFEDIDTVPLDNSDELLDELLSYHIVPGKRILADSIDDGDQFVTLNGERLTLRQSESSIQVNDDTLTTTNLGAANGVVHLVSGVLLEGVDAAHRMLLSPEHRLFVSLVADAELTTLLSGSGPDNEDGLTVFAPTNQAILNAYDENGNGELEEEEGPQDVTRLVKYHVVDDVYRASDVPSSGTEVTTLEGSTVTIQRNDSQLSVNDAGVPAPDQVAENGVVHGIDTVLTPPGS